MNTYLIVKTLHIISATLMVGTGFGTAFYLFWANRSGSVAAQSVVSHWVIKADWWFTTPAVIFQPLSGLWMLYERGYTVATMLEQNWVWMTLALHFFRHLLAACCLAANPHGKNCRKSAQRKRRHHSGTLLALRQTLGIARLPCLLRHYRDLLPDGDETDLKVFRRPY